MSALCLIAPDLSMVRIRALGSEEVWTLPAPSAARTDGAETDERDASWWKAQAVDAARWVAHRCGAGRRLAVACVDVSESSCVWLSAPSADPDIVAASLRMAGEEWEALDPGSTVQPVVGPRGNAATKRATRVFGVRIAGEDGPAQAVRMPVIVSSDALVRLWLDELNRSGVRVGVVASLWHAMASGWRSETTASGAEIEAVALCDGERLVWCWSRAGRLLTGGWMAIPRVRSEEEPDEPPSVDARAAMARLSLDWLSWAAQIGDTPQRVTLVGSDVEALAAPLEESWPDARVERVPTEDAIGATLSRVEQRLSEGDSGAEPAYSDEDPRESMVALSRRRGRAHQRLYTGVGATCALLAVGIGALGWRAREHASALRREVDNARDSSKAMVMEVAPGLAESASPRMAALSALEAMRKEQPTFSDPPAARPIMDEAARVLSVMSDLSSRGLQFDELVLHEGLPSGAMTAPDFETGEEVSARLRAAPGRIRWDVQFERRDGNLYKYRLTGQWTEETK